MSVRRRQPLALCDNVKNKKYLTIHSPSVVRFTCHSSRLISCDHQLRETPSWCFSLSLKIYSKNGRL